MIVCHLKENKEILRFNECDYISFENEGKIIIFKTSEEGDVIAIIPVENILWIERR